MCVRACVTAHHFLPCPHPTAQLSLLLHQERSVLLQQRGLLEQLSAAEMPLEVQPKVQRSRELVQQQLKLLDEQTTTMTVSDSAAQPLLDQALCYLCIVTEPYVCEMACKSV